MSLIPLPVEQAATLSEQIGLPERFRTSNITRPLLHSPLVYAAFIRFHEYFVENSTLEKRSRELLILRLGWKTASEYVFCRHMRVAMSCMTEEEALGVRDPAACTRYSEADRAVLQATDELIECARISAPTWSRLEKAFSPAQIIEIMMAAGLWRTYATLTNSAGIVPEDGYGSWPEEKAPPPLRQQPGLR